MIYKVALFGEAEKGDFYSLLPFNTLSHLAETLGHPPDGSYGLHLAIQTLLFKKEVVYIRVKEEGFSLKDYMKGLDLLQDSEKGKGIKAVCMPGVGDVEIVERALNFCNKSGSILITKETDFYDYMTEFQKKPR